jgi:dTDP-4-dehydrorhamnose reductase
MREVLFSSIVIGGDGLIGSHIAEKLRFRGQRVSSTTRRAGKISEDVFPLDLETGADLPRAAYPGTGGTAFLCAGITNISACEADAECSRVVNVRHTLELSKKLLEAGIRLIFLSSNAVFDGSEEGVDEVTAPCPSTEYGRQKAAVERELGRWQSLGGSIAIVRLSKVISAVLGSGAEFRRHLLAGEVCHAFEDLKMSPISLAYAADNLIAIARSGHTGIFHLAGEEEMSYAEFARRMAVCLNADTALVRPVSSKRENVKIVYRPAHPVLGMVRTTELLGIRPEPMASVLEELTGRVDGHDCKN